jgi:hypothetical protein
VIKAASDLIATRMINGDYMQRALPLPSRWRSSER